MSEPLRYIVTYLREVTQPVRAVSLEDAGNVARDFAVKQGPGLRVLSVYAEPALTPAPTP